MTATASEPIHLGRARASAPSSVTPGGTPRIAGRGERLHVGRTKGLWRWKTVFMDSLELLALVWSIPLAMLAVGTPIALAIALLVWLGRLALSAL